MKISLLLLRFATVLRFSMWACWYKHVYNQFIHVYTSIYRYIQGYTSGAWHEQLSELPHSTISRTLWRMLWAISKFHLAFSPVLSGRFRWSRSRRSTAFCCSSGSSDNGIRDWRVEMFQSMHWMSTSTTSLLGSATWGKPYRRDAGLAPSIAALMSLT